MATDTQKQISLADFATQVVTKVSPADQSFFLMFHTTVANMTALLPIGAYPSVDAAEKARAELDRVFGFCGKYSHVIAPLGRWGSVDEGADVKKVLEASFHDIRRSQQERKLGLQGVTPEVQRILERIAKTPNLPIPMPPSPESKGAAVVQEPEQELKPVHQVFGSAAVPAVVSEAPLPETNTATTATETATPATVPSEDFYTPEESTKQVQAALDSLPDDQARAMLQMLQRKLGVEAPQATAPMYKPGQQEAFNGLTPKQKAELRRRMMKARRTNNQAEIDAICKKFGPIVVVDNPEIKDHLPTGQ